MTTSTTTSTPTATFCGSMDCSFPRNLTSNSSNSTDIPDIHIHNFQLFEFVIWFTVYGIIAVLAVFGNALVMYVISTRKIMQNVPNYFILNLAICDFVTGLISVPFKFQAVLQQKWTLPGFMCQLLTFTETMTLSVNVFTLTGGAIDRFIIVVLANNSKMSRKTALIIIAGIWFISIVLSLPFGLLHKTIPFHYESPMNPIDHVDLYRPEDIMWRCLPIFMTSKYWNWYNIYLTIIEYFVPLIIIDVAYILIVVVIFMSEPANQACRRFHKDRKKVIKLLVLVVIMFTFCWFPYELYLMLCEITPWINEFYYINVVFMCLHCLAMSNSSLNPIIYGIFNKKFRREYIRVFRRLRGKRPGITIMLQSLKKREMKMLDDQQNEEEGLNGNAGNVTTADFIAGELGT